MKAYKDLLDALEAVIPTLLKWSTCSYAVKVTIEFCGVLRVASRH